MVNPACRQDKTGAFSIIAAFKSPTRQQGQNAGASMGEVQTLLLQAMFSLGKLSINHKLPRIGLPFRLNLPSASKTRQALEVKPVAVSSHFSDRIRKRPFTEWRSNKINQAS